MTRSHWLRAAWGVLLLIWAGAVPAAPVGTVTQLEGRADLTRGDAPARPLRSGEAIERRDVLRTKSDSSLELTLSDGSRINMGPATRLVVAEYVVADEPDGLFEVTRGWIRTFVSDVFSERKESFRVETPTAAMGVQGTDFAVKVQAFATRVVVYSGIVAVRNINPLLPQRRVLRAAQTTVVEKDRAPQPPRAVGPGERVGSGRGGKPPRDESPSADDEGLTPNVPPLNLPPRPNLPSQTPNLPGI